MSEPQNLVFEKGIVNFFAEKENFTLHLLRLNINGEEEFNEALNNNSFFLSKLGDAMTAAGVDEEYVQATLKAPYVEKYDTCLARTPGDLAAACYFMNIDEDNWYGTETILKIISESYMRRSSDYWRVVKGITRENNSCMLFDGMTNRHDILVHTNTGDYTMTAMMLELRD